MAWVGLVACPCGHLCAWAHAACPAMHSAAAHVLPWQLPLASQVQKWLGGRRVTLSEGSRPDEKLQLLPGHVHKVMGVLTLGHHPLQPAPVSSCFPCQSGWTTHCHHHGRTDG